MEKVIIWGAGGTGRRVYNKLKQQKEVIAFVDMDSHKWNTKYENIPICEPEMLKTLSFDKIYLGTLMGYEEIYDIMDQMGISLNYLNNTYVAISVESRIFFLERFAERVKKENISGAVGEAGVYRGEFAKHINSLFADRTCYLFDTFDGFADCDIEKEELDSLVEAEHLRATSQELVYNKMPNKEKIVIRKGIFPKTTAEGINDDHFVFVNLDMDLYQPTLEGLKYFYPKMSEGGVILIHDYFTEVYPNIEKAVNDFEKEHQIRLKKLPIGDDISLAIIK